MRLLVLGVFLTAEFRPPEEFHTPQALAVAARIRQAFGRAPAEAARFPGMLWPMTARLTGDALDFHGGLDAAVENCRRHGGDWELGVTLMLRTHVAIDLTGGLPTVDTDLAELHEIARRVGDRWTRAQVASAAGEVALSRGQYDWARAEYEECLRLAREVGAHMEAPFAIARIAEAAHSTGDTDGAARLLAEADREADRYGVVDVRAYIQLLGALIALQRGDCTEARARSAMAREAADRTTVPAQFTAGLAFVEALLAGREHGPAEGLAVAGPALAEAVAAHCAERVLAVLAEAAAVLLADADRPADAVRVLAAATAWRAGHPRSVPEPAVIAGLPERTRAALGPEGHARAEAAGARLSPVDVARALNGS